MAVQATTNSKANTTTTIYGVDVAMTPFAEKQATTP